MCRDNIIKDLASTNHSLLDRISMISMTHEAKGLDAGPRLINNIKSMPHNKKILDIFSTIVKEEVDHVKFGIKWYDV